MALGGPATFHVFVHDEQVVFGIEESEEHDGVVSVAVVHAGEPFDGAVFVNAVSDMDVGAEGVEAAGRLPTPIFMGVPVRSFLELNRKACSNGIGTGPGVVPDGSCALQVCPFCAGTEHVRGEQKMSQQMSSMPDLKPLFEAIRDGDARTARTMAEQALGAGVAPAVLVQDYMIPAMAEVGRRFECNEYFVPELLISARAMKSALELIRPLLVAGGVQLMGRVVIGTVRGDLHEIGKNLVAAMLEGGGYEVVDLGVNVEPEKFAAMASQSNAQLVAMSALLTTTMPAMKNTIEALRKAGIRDRVRVLVGGAPISQRFAEEIGADGFSESAAGAVRLAREVTAGKAG